MTFGIRAEQHTVLNGLLNVCIMWYLCVLRFIFSVITAGLGTNKWPTFLYLIVRCLDFSLRHAVASGTLEMSLVTFCVRKKNNNLAMSVPSEYTVVFPECLLSSNVEGKVSWLYVLLMNRSFSVSAILPFAALDRSLLYLWIYCALISCRSLLPFRFPQQLCFHTVQRAFYRRKKKLNCFEFIFVPLFEDLLQETLTKETSMP